MDDSTQHGKDVKCIISQLQNTDLNVTGETIAPYLSLYIYSDTMNLVFQCINKQTVLLFYDVTWFPIDSFNEEHFVMKISHSNQ
jgi:hypothetical protein